MAERFALTLDLGSSGLRAALHPVDRPWEITRSAERRYRTYRPRDPDALSSHFVEPELWTRICTAIAEAMAGQAANEIAVVGITAQRGGIALLDGNGKAIHLAPNTDLRAVFEGAAMDEEFGAEIYTATGHAPSLFLAPARLAWWHTHHPRIAQRITHVTTLGGWAAYRLTGEHTSVPSELSEAGLLDVTTSTPPAGLLARIGFDAALLPPLRDEGHPAGTLTSSAAEAMGLVAGTPVHLAGPDTHASVLSTGAVEPGAAAIVAGWSAPVQVVTGAPAFDGQRRTWTGPHLVPQRWYAEASAGDTGGTLDMVRTLLGPRGAIDRLDGLLSRSRRGANLVTAFWGPHAYNLSDAGIAMGGMLAPVPITYNAVRPAHMARAAVENIAYAIRECLELATTVAGTRAARSVALTGGMAASTIFPQILADVLNAAVRRHHPRGSAIGAALAASRPRSDWAGAAADLARRSTIVEPDVRGVVEYKEAFARWQRLRQRLDELTDEL